MIISLAPLAAQTSGFSDAFRFKDGAESSSSASDSTDGFASSFILSPWSPYYSLHLCRSSVSTKCCCNCLLSTIKRCMHTRFGKAHQRIKSTSTFLLGWVRTWTANPAFGQSMHGGYWLSHSLKRTVEAETKLLSPEGLECCDLVSRAEVLHGCRILQSKMDFKCKRQTTGDYTRKGRTSCRSWKSRGS